MGFFVGWCVGAPTQMHDKTISNTAACTERDGPVVTWTTSISANQGGNAACQGNKRLGTLTEGQRFERRPARQRQPSPERQW